jgi:Domain of unknown function (DUF932)
MTKITMLSDEASWRARKVRYYSGDWEAICSVIPEFELAPLTAGPDEPENPFLQLVMRRPLTSAERKIPIGIVSKNYGLVPHREVSELCRSGIIDAGISSKELRYEVGLSELGEWMNFRIYLPPSFSFEDEYGENLDLRLECFNSVDGSARLVIVLGWIRFICTNGVIIGETKIEIKERHVQKLDVCDIRERIGMALKLVSLDRDRLEKSQDELVAINQIQLWVDDAVAKKWGIKAAARIFHICKSGRDIEFSDPFALGKASEKPVRYLDPVPGSVMGATTKYDVLQALSFVASHRNNAEERLTWQADVSALLNCLPCVALSSLVQPRRSPE